MWYHYLAAVLAAAVPAAVFLCVRAAQKNREEVPVANVSVQGKEVRCFALTDMPQAASKHAAVQRCAPPQPAGAERLYEALFRCRTDTLVIPPVLSGHGQLFSRLALQVSTTPHHVSLTFDKPQGETVTAVTESTSGTTETSVRCGGPVLSRAPGRSVVLGSHASRILSPLILHWLVTTSVFGRPPLDHCCRNGDASYRAVFGLRRRRRTNRDGG